MADKRGKFDPNNAYGSAVRWVAVTPSETVPIEIRPDALYPGSDGVVEMEDIEGTVMTVKATEGVILPYRPIRVGENSTVDPIYALYCQ